MLSMMGNDEVTQKYLNYLTVKYSNSEIKLPSHTGGNQLENKPIQSHTGGNQIIDNELPNNTGGVPIDVNIPSHTDGSPILEQDKTGHILSGSEVQVGDWKENILIKSNNDRHKYYPRPNLEDITGFSDLTVVKPKTPIQGGGGLRKRWMDSKGNIYEWDSQHGALEKYNKKGKHLGEFDYKTGIQTKPANSTRKVEP
ncbi:colicin E3/pyocin S6 family cytotoxin [Avibacterium endocarditidis]|uniref:colicin E3/pyocin S6 family cytotoxin n=1 Tax=Avibacterium endocarditidis TaxID=380674 RepID=UPI0039FC3C51